MKDSRDKVAYCWPPASKMSTLGLSKLGQVVNM